MKKTTATIAGLGILALVAYPALADDADTTAGTQSTVTFSDLSMVDGSADDGTCSDRYSNGYTATHTEQNDQGQQQIESDQGHDILITETDGTVGAGIYTLSNTYEIVFPNGDDTDAVELQMFASGLSGETPITGFFSDGTCRGQVSIQIDNSPS